ncbi:hypothetical protein SLE2022_370150 [Rubroshorea leprosula]
MHQKIQFFPPEFESNPSLKAFPVISVKHQGYSLNSLPFFPPLTIYIRLSAPFLTSLPPSSIAAACLLPFFSSSSRSSRISGAESVSVREFDRSDKALLSLADSDLGC